MGMTGGFTEDFLRGFERYKTLQQDLEERQQREQDRVVKEAPRPPMRAAAGARRGPHRRAQEVAELHDLITNALKECRDLLNDPQADVAVQDVVDAINAKEKPGHPVYTPRTLLYRVTGRKRWRELWDPTWNWPRGFSSSSTATADSARTVATPDPDVESPRN
jgi:hypothetical protein